MKEKTAQEFLDAQSFQDKLQQDKFNSAVQKIIVELTNEQYNKRSTWFRISRFSADTNLMTQVFHRLVDCNFRVFIRKNRRTQAQELDEFSYVHRTQRRWLVHIEPRSN
ncbi:MAG: hypothetical protein ACI4VP_04655 [Clostridia bacterium]